MPHRIPKIDLERRVLRPLHGTWGSEVRAYESSYADGAHIWLDLRVPQDEKLSAKAGTTIEIAAHLTTEDALRLAGQLVWLVEHHYQLRDRYALAEVEERLHSDLVAMQRSFEPQEMEGEGA